MLRFALPRRFRPSAYLCAKARRKTSGRVLMGPFVGMRYVETAVGSQYIPKLLGIYEKELQRSVEELSCARWETIVNVGAGEGYYAIGLALRCPTARVVAFEADPIGQDLLREMAKLNGVGNRLEVRGRCELPDLATCCDRGAANLLMCDVEGYESVLVDPMQVDWLKSGHILVELHDFITPNIGDELRARFATSHDITELAAEPRAVSEFPFSDPYIRLLPRRYLAAAVSERRAASMSWLVMRPYRTSTGKAQLQSVTPTSSQFTA